ncbi:FAD-dependent oxidoreductase [Sphingosinicella sp. LHD-64]|uniref:FAD-dependent oxidoreductase n=1 Tax=Sphingosinicella sp. LHD-64 TaxID=3072139 RepID=UPI00280F64BF|nr:FAD-dependent oxidoreductase [Sphingosinicella sp. LHD-64]MDQ8755772.1 FAD-dependent oxidoreductase [Sphingosinicella sp. LHD-64]
MSGLTRRFLLTASAAAAGSAVLPKSLRAQSRRRPDIVVVGAGVFGAWTAKRLQEGGRSVLLLDAWGPAHARASSGGESRMTRGAYGADEVYTRMATDSLSDWQALSDRAGLPLFHRTGVLFFFPRVEPFLEQTMAVHRRIGLPTELLDAAALRRRFPQIDFAGIEAGLFEPGFGALMARRAVQTLVAGFVRAGGGYRQAAVAPPRSDADTLAAIRTVDGATVAAERFVFACGPWLGRVFPDLLAARIFPTRQEVFFFAPPPGDRRFAPDRFPGWADFNGGDIYYGFPDLEARGFKIAHDAHGPRMDPDTGDRTPSAAALADVRAFMARRFPALADRPLSEARVCQYENSSNGDLLIDRHPRWRNVVLVGAGSGHGFKHGPAVGRYAADLVLGRLATPEPRFSLATKAETENRAVH